MAINGGTSPVKKAGESNTPSTRHFIGYVGTEWQCGDVITAERLNNYENQLELIGNGILAIGQTVEWDTESEGYLVKLDKTLFEIKQALTLGKLPVLFEDIDGEIKPYIFNNYDSGTIYFYASGKSVNYDWDTEDSYPYHYIWE